MLRGYDYKLAERFVSDYRLPVLITSDRDCFEYELELYEGEFGSMTKWSALLDGINSEYDGDSDAFLEDYHATRDRIIVETAASDEYKRFCSDDAAFARWRSADIPKAVNTKSVYNRLNAGRRLVSFDMRNANFQALKAAGVIKDETYADFIGRFCSGFMKDYVANSKYSRNVIFGKLNAKRQITLEKYMITKFYRELVEPAYKGRLMCVNSDEIILEDDPLGGARKALEEAAEKSPLDLRTEFFEFDTYELRVRKPDGTAHKLSEFYKKKISGQTKPVWKGVPLPFRKIIKAINRGLEPCEDDKTMLFDGCRVEMLDELIVEQVE